VLWKRLCFAVCAPPMSLSLAPEWGSYTSLEWSMYCHVMHGSSCVVTCLPLEYQQELRLAMYCSCSCTDKYADTCTAAIVLLQAWSCSCCSTV
jgi:hypothetical protein